MDGTVRAAAACVVAASSIVGVLAGVAHADTIVVSGDREGQSATVVCEFNSQTRTLSFTLTNTSTSAVVTAIGFDLVAGDFGDRKSAGLNGFSGTQAPSITSDLVFRDDALGAVPHVRSAVLDFGFTTGRTFRSGDEATGVDPGDSASFTVSGAGFGTLTEEQICASVFVRFQ